MKMKHFQRLMAFVLVLCMVIPMLPEFTLPAVATGTSTTEDPVIVIAGSDFQPETECDTTIVTNILTYIKDTAGYSAVDGFLFAGDYTQDGYNEAYSKPGLEALQGVVKNVYPDLKDDYKVYIQGNHDPDSMATDGTLSASGAHDADAYGVYVINEKDYMWYNNDETTIKNTATALDTYLDAKIAADYDKPIFVVSHLPLHYNMRTANDGDGQYANYIFDVLNSAGAKGLNIIFLFGHNHSNGWDDYLGGSAVYLAKGDSINIAQASKTEFAVETLNFTYMNAGYVGYYRGVNDGSERDLTMTVFEIRGNEVTIFRYSESGLHDLKSKGVTNSAKNETAYAPNTRVYGSPQYAKLGGEITDAGVTVEANGVTSLSVKKATYSNVPSGYRAYQTYDITTKGFTEGNTATVTITVDSSFDASFPTFVIDHEKNRTIPVEIVDGKVTFTTDHFSLYTVAQENTPSYNASGTINGYYKRVKVLEAGKSYVIVSYVNGMILTDDKQSFDFDTTGIYTGFVLAEGELSDGDLWYYDGTYLLHGGDTNKYLKLSYWQVFLESTASNTGRLVRNIYLNHDGTTFSLERPNGDSPYYLKRHTAGTVETASSFANSDGNATDDAKWYFYEPVETADVTLTVTPSRSTVTAGKTISLVPTVLADGDSVDEYEITYSSSDPTIAVVSADGTVTGYKTGRVTITATLSAAGGYDLTAPISVDIPLSVVTVSKNDIIITGSGMINNVPVEVEVGDPSETIKVGSAYVIRPTSNTSLILSGTEKTVNGEDGLSLVSENPFDHIWYFDGNHLCYGSPTGTSNYLGYKSGSLHIGAIDDGTTDISIIAEDTHGASQNYSIRFEDGQTNKAYLNFYGDPANQFAYYWTGSGQGSSWIFYEVIPGDVDMTVSFPKSTLIKNDEITVLPAVQVNGNPVSNSNCTIEWTSSNTAVAKVDSTGKVTAVADGEAIITAKLTAADGYTLDDPAVVEIPLTVTSETVNTDSVTASAVVGDFLGEFAQLEAGVPSGPYVVKAYNTNNTTTPVGDILTGIKNVQNSNCTGLGMVSENDFSHLWYYDGTYMLYGSPVGTDNYLAYVDDMVTLAEKADGITLFNKIAQYSNWTTHYTITGDGISGYINQLGGMGNTAVGLYGQAAYSRWLFAPAYKNANVTLSVTPGNALLYPDETVTLDPTVWLDGKDMDNYTISWTSSDTSAATVASNGVVTAQSAGGHAIITATLTAVDGGTLPVPVSVEIPVQVVKVTTDENSVTASYTTDDTLERVTDVQPGVPYVITAKGTGRVLSGVAAYTAHSDAFPGLRLTSGSDLSHVWYINETNLLYDSVEGNANYMIVDSSKNVLLSTYDVSTAINSIKLNGDGASYTITNTNYTNGENVHEYGGEPHNVVHGYDNSGNSNSGSAWYFNAIVSGKTYSLKVTPGSSTIYAGHNVKLTPAVMVDDIVQTSYRLTWTSSDSSVALVQNGVVTAVAGGQATITATLTAVDGTALDAALSVQIPITVTGVTSATLDRTTGFVAQRSATSAKTGANLTVTYSDDTTETVPVTVAMLTGSDDSRISAYTAGTFSGLTVNYGGYQVKGFELTVVPRVQSDYPAYPEEGSVIVDKNGVGIDFQSTGIAQIELSTTGVPSKKGADVIIMLDTSSSMNNPISEGSSVTRLHVLTESLNDLINRLQADGVDGEPMDIRIAVADFNGYYSDSNSPYYINPNDTTTDNYIRSGSYYAVSSNSIYTGNNTLTAGALINVHEMGQNPFDASNYNGSTSGKYTLVTHGGTNYDYAFDAVYQLGESINSANVEAGEDRDLFVVFMSDGAPFQYNYFSSQSGPVSSYPGAVYWNNWLLGTFDEETMYGANANKTYYNEDGLHWMAEAIKGSPTEFYDVIRKNNKKDIDGDTWVEVQGLGATMYSIGFCLQEDDAITVESMETVIRNIASSEEYYSRADSAEGLTEAFNKITNEIFYAATNAYFIDEMGEDYDIKLKPYTYAGGTKTITPTIEVKSYSIYTNQDAAEGLCAESQIGSRKLDDNGKEIYTLLEKVTFNDDGTAAYSNGGTTNILKDGVICASTFWYNTTSTAKTITLDDGSTYSLPAETFYWKVGTISTAELTLSYYVYLTGSMEGTRAEGIYDTNEHAELKYINYLGHACEQSVPTPRLPWKQATVGYGFYLVDKNGNPIVNQTTGETGSFSYAVKLTNPTYQHFLLNSEGAGFEADRLEAGSVLPAGYALYDTGAAYKVQMDSTGDGYYIIDSNTTVQTTYVAGLGSAAVTNTGTPGTQIITTGYATASTIVWFAVTATTEAVPDTVVIDYGLAVDIHPLVNDLLMTTGNAKLYGIGIYNEKTFKNYTSNAPSFETTGWLTIEGYGKAKITADGASNINNAVVQFVPGTMQMDREVVFTYAVHYTGTVGSQGYYYSTITVIPATTIYYEDNFDDVDGDDYITFSTYTQVGDTTSDAANAWETVQDTDTSSPNETQAEDRPGDYDIVFGNIDANNIYGYDGAYTAMEMYSNCSAHKFTASKVTANGVTTYTYGTAEFTFMGTGFDVISLTSHESGTIVVAVDDLKKTNVEDEAEYYYVVDTYYGYKYGDDPSTTDTTEVWYVDTTSSDTLYQVPVMKVEGLDYSRYKVTITVTYNDFFDHRQDGSYDFYLDAIRIYDPANDGTNNTVVQGAYTDDAEGWPTYVELRNMIIPADKTSELNSTDATHGILFIDGRPTQLGNEYWISDYTNFGPNNELYLAPNQAIAFELADYSNVASVQIALKTVGDFSTGTNGSVNGIPDGSGVASVSIYDASDAKQVNVISASNIATATDLYYDITSLMGKTVIIENTGDKGILSITNVKITYKQDPYGASDSSLINTTGNTVPMALAALNAAENLEQSPATGDMGLGFVMMVLTASMLMLAVLVLPSIRKRTAK